MKFNVQLELDWIDEDGNIDDVIKQELIEKISAEIHVKSLNAIEDKASNCISKSINDAIKKTQEAIQKRALEFAEDWLNKEITVTDEWSDPKKELSIKDLIKETFSNLLQKKVNKSGQFSDSYNTVKLIDYISDKKVKDEVEKQIGNLSSNIDSQIKKAIDSELKDKIGAKFAQLVLQATKEK